MPIHDYECKTCGHRFDFMKIRSDDRVECEKCGEKDERKLEQQVSKDTGFILKGRGWAKDRYGK